jgi:hypothetical protein
MLSRTCDFFSFNCCSFKVSCTFGHARIREHSARKCTLSLFLRSCASSPLDQVQKAKEGTGRVVLWRELGITVRRSVFCSCHFQTITWRHDPFLNLYILNLVFCNTVLFTRILSLWKRRFAGQISAEGAPPQPLSQTLFATIFTIAKKIAVTTVSALAATSTFLTIYTSGSVFVTSFLTFGIPTRCLNHTHPYHAPHHRPICHFEYTLTFTPLRAISTPSCKSCWPAAIRSQN